MKVIGDWWIEQLWDKLISCRLFFEKIMLFNMFECLMHYWLQYIDILEHRFNISILWSKNIDTWRCERL